MATRRLDFLRRFPRTVPAGKEWSRDDLVSFDRLAGHAKFKRKETVRHIDFFFAGKRSADLIVWDFSPTIYLLALLGDKDFDGGVREEWRQGRLGLSSTRSFLKKKFPNLSGDQWAALRYVSAQKTQIVHI